MADKSAIGSTDEPFEMVVDRSKIREFARATKSQNTAYLDDPDAVSEPTFLMSSAFWAPAGSSLFAKVGLDLRRILHGGQEFVFHGPPPRAGSMRRSAVARTTSRPTAGLFVTPIRKPSRRIPR